MSEEIKLAVLHRINELTEGKLISLIAYGSRIAGYARRDSDYDFLGVIEDFKEIIRYYYINLDSASAALLLVDRKKFEEDVERGTLGEFVSGRLCTVFENVYQGDFFSAQEVKFKRRIILEELGKLKIEFKELLPYLLIPIRYFLYSKLKERISYYPPVKYSYVKMFFGDRGEINTNKSLIGFINALKQLETYGIVNIIEDKVRVINPDEIKAENRAKLCLKFIKKVLRSYLTHIKAGKVSPMVFLYELLSKGRRAIEGIKIPAELKKPKDLISLAEGTIFSYSRASLKKLIERICGKNAQIVDEKREKSFLGTVFRIRVKVGEEEKTYAYKKYTDPGNLKWIPVTLYIFPVVSFTLHPKKRMINEYIFNLRLRNLGLKTPRIMALNWGSNSILMEYVEGKPLSDYISNRELGKSRIELFFKTGRRMSELHLNNICLVDTKPQNMIVRDNEIFFTDLEQARFDGNQAWDLALFVYYGSKFILDRNWVKTFVSSFIKGYLAGGGDPLSVRKIASLKYMRIFAPFVPLTTLKSIADLIKEI
ncbi:hypothetical protein DRN86_01810 [Candidatus Geothermarchaeota archaeon]|nr:MAG: hypothetical protein DRN86_01810 [Candidatus Geothermarchaeota archaeon]